MNADSWIQEARGVLDRLHVEGSGWRYGPAGEVCAEPTAMACLASSAVDPGGDSVRASSGAKWLASVQQQDGAIGVSPALPVPQWPTAHAVLVWANARGYDGPLSRALRWLIEMKGETYRRTDRIGHDTSIAGWPWVADTHSWLEPTAIAVIALRRTRYEKHTRTVQGLTLIRDRAIATGGWNYGNNSVYGTNLRPQPAATGLALLALSGTQARDEMIAKACEYLTRSLAATLSCQALGWGLLGLAAWGQRPADAGRWLERAFRAARRDESLRLSMLLLASTDRSLQLLGATGV